MSRDACSEDGSASKIQLSGSLISSKYATLPPPPRPPQQIEDSTIQLASTIHTVDLSSGEQRVLSPPPRRPPPQSRRVQADSNAAASSPQSVSREGSQAGAPAAPPVADPKVNTSALSSSLRLVLPPPPLVPAVTKSPRSPKSNKISPLMSPSSTPTNSAWSPARPADVSSATPPALLSPDRTASPLGGSMRARAPTVASDSQAVVIGRTNRGGTVLGTAPAYTSSATFSAASNPTSPRHIQLSQLSLPPPPPLIQRNSPPASPPSQPLVSPTMRAARAAAAATFLPAFPLPASSSVSPAVKPPDRPASAPADKMVMNAAITTSSESAFSTLSRVSLPSAPVSAMPPPPMTLAVPHPTAPLELPPLPPTLAMPTVLGETASAELTLLHLEDIAAPPPPTYPSPTKSGALYASAPLPPPENLGMLPLPPVEQLGAVPQPPSSPSASASGSRSGSRRSMGSVEPTPAGNSKPPSRPAPSWRLPLPADQHGQASDAVSPPVSPSKGSTKSTASPRTVGNT